MTDHEVQRLGAILYEIRDNQKLRLDRQTEALAPHREQLAPAQRQAERHERIQGRAEHIQAKSAQIVAVTRRTLFFILPVVTLLIIYVSRLNFR